MRGRRIADLLALPVRMHGIQLGRPVRALVDARDDRLLGLELVCGDGAHRFLPFAVATLLYNRHVTGSFTEFPITFADPLDTFGFGTKSIATRWPKTPYGLRDAVRGVGRNLLNLPLFMFGTFAGLVIAAVGLWFRRRDRSTIALLLLAAAFPVGYFFFWGISLSASFSSVSGPIAVRECVGPRPVQSRSRPTTALEIRRRQRPSGRGFDGASGIMSTPSWPPVPRSPGLFSPNFAAPKCGSSTRTTCQPAPSRFVEASCTWRISRGTEPACPE